MILHVRTYILFVSIGVCTEALTINLFNDLGIKIIFKLLFIPPPPHTHTQTPTLEGFSNLSVSRTIGDFNFKPPSTLPPELQAVTPAPDINVVSRDLATDEFLVLASDGVFKSLSSAQVSLCARVTAVHGNTYLGFKEWLPMLSIIGPGVHSNLLTGCAVCTASVNDH